MRAPALLVSLVSLLAPACGDDTAGPIDAATDLDAPPGADAAGPTFETDFGTGGALWRTRSQPEGAIDLDAISAQAADGRVAMLVFAGDPALGPNDRTSPDFATEIETVAYLHFGTYRWRARLATCASGEEVVNGLFIYGHDGGDANGNGIEDNNEIDIEVLCGEPTVLWLTSWTDFQDSGGTASFHKRSRAVDLATGALWETPAGGEGTYDMVPAGTLPAAQSSVSLADQFTEMGFDWAPDHVRWFIVLGDREVTLWDLRDPTVIPQGEAELMFNLWHSPTHWLSGGTADYPALDATLLIDWVRYWAVP